LHGKSAFVDKAHSNREFPVSSGNLEGFTKFTIIRSDPATGLTGKFHCGKFLFAHMGRADIALATI